MLNLAAGIFDEPNPDMKQALERARHEPHRYRLADDVRRELQDAYDAFRREAQRLGRALALDIEARNAATRNTTGLSPRDR